MCCIILFIIHPLSAKRILLEGVLKVARAQADKPLSKHPFGFKVFSLEWLLTPHNPQSPYLQTTG